MKTSDAIVNVFVCPKCKDNLCDDKKGRGYVRHKYTKNCSEGRGEKDQHPTEGK